MLIGIFIGLVFGVAIAAAVIWYVNKIPIPFVERESAARASTSDVPMNLPGKPGDAASDAANKTAAPPVGVANALPEVTSAAPEKRHYLQAGSFSNPIEADNLRATLAMQGIEANVRQVILQNKTYYRLMLGPYEKKADADQSSARLALLGIETLLVNQE